MLAVDCAMMARMSLADWLLALGKAAHFTGGHCKAAALFAGARRFDRGIQGENVGLEGQAIDDADNLANLFRACVHCAHHLV